MAKFILGYDPGGAFANGVAYLELSEDNKINGFDFGTASTTDEVLDWFFLQQAINPDEVIGAGIDSLLSWSTVGTFRPMDYYLKTRYAPVESSIFSVNSARGAMAIQGVVFAHEIARCLPNILFINETHPKVAYYAQTGLKHDYLVKPTPAPLTNENGRQSAPAKNFHEENAIRMWNELTTLMKRDAGPGFPSQLQYTIPVDDHAWDALFSAWFTYYYGQRQPINFNLMDLKALQLLHANLSKVEQVRVHNLQNRFNNWSGPDGFGQMLSDRILVPTGLEGLVKYWWMP